MAELHQLEIGVWREVSWQPDICHFTQTIAASLLKIIPLEQLLVCLIDQERSCLETAAWGFPQSENGPANARTDCSTTHLEQLLVWSRRGEASPIKDNDFLWSIIKSIVPDAQAAEVVCGPLSLQSGKFGVLIVVSANAQSFDEEHLVLINRLLEPFSIALEKDRQLRETAALREAAEAEKQSLLTRLGREKLADTIVGADSGLRAVMQRVELVVRSDVPVLIFGETGSGKELVARAIHIRSRRATGPFMRVNCGTIPPELIDSQLFAAAGRDRRAAAGRTGPPAADRPGRFFRTRGRASSDQRGRADRGRHAPRPGGHGGRWPLSRRPVVSPCRVPNRLTAVAGAPRGHSRSGPALRPAGGQTLQPLSGHAH
jgi:hydrogenase-4 transcriptional activator